VGSTAEGVRVIGTIVATILFFSFPINTLY
jgi:hypothetical protein